MRRMAATLGLLVLVSVGCGDGPGVETAHEASRVEERITGFQERITSLEKAVSRLEIDLRVRERGVTLGRFERTEEPTEPFSVEACVNGVTSALSDLSSELRTYFYSTERKRLCAERGLLAQTSEDVWWVLTEGKTRGLAGHAAERGYSRLCDEIQRLHNYSAGCF